jgi:ankyrin repeat protein
MSTPLSLPSRPDLHWLKNRAKERLEELRRRDPSVRLADAQREVARAYGFPSWRALKARVDAMRAAAGPAEAPPVEFPDAAVQAFLRAVGAGQRDAVERALSLAPALVNAVGPHPYWGGRPQPLHVAIETHRRDVFDLLIDRGADVNGEQAQYMNWSPLLLSVHRNRSEMTRVLLERGARVGLSEALALGDDARVDAILGAHGARALEDPAPNAGTLLHFARTPHAIDRLLALGVELDRPDHWGASAVEALSRLGPSGASLVAHLAARGAAVGPAELARVGDRTALERRFASDPDAVRAPATFKAAVDFGHHALVLWLLERGCDVNGRSGGRADETPLHSAAWNGDLEMTRLLVEAGADVNARDRQYVNTPLGWAETAIEVTNNPRCADVAEYLRARMEP